MTSATRLPAAEAGERHVSAKRTRTASLTIAPTFAQRREFNIMPSPAGFGRAASYAEPFLLATGIVRRTGVTKSA